MKSAIWIFNVGCLVLGLIPQTDIQQPAKSSAIPILLYHSVTEETDDSLKMNPARFEQELSYLRSRGYHPLFFTDLQDGVHGQQLPPKPVIITLDDGYEDNFTNAYPILKRTGMKATVFTITGNMGKPGYLTWGQLRTMESSGIVDTESHTVTHPDMTKLNFKEKVTELVNSHQAIYRELGHSSIAFAYPYGKYDNESIEAVRLTGYMYAVTTEPGYAEAKQGLLTLHRIMISAEMTLKEFRAILP